MAQAGSVEITKQSLDLQFLPNLIWDT